VRGAVESRRRFNADRLAALEREREAYAAWGREQPALWQRSRRLAVRAPREQDLSRFSHREFLLAARAAVDRPERRR